VQGAQGLLTCLCIILCYNFCLLFNNNKNKHDDDDDDVGV